MNNALCPTPDELKPGSTVEIETAFNEIIIGEVYCFDYPSRILTLKKKSSNGNSKLHDITIVNLNNCRDIKTPKNSERKKECEIGDAILPDIDFGRLEARVHNAVEERNSLAKSFKSGAGTTGVLLYHQLVKTFGESHVQLTGDSIIVQKSVTISAPYKPDNLFLRDPKEKLAEDSISYVRAIIEKFWASYTPSETSTITNTNPSQKATSTVASSSSTAAAAAAAPVATTVPLNLAAVVKMNPPKQQQTKDSHANAQKPLRA